MNAYKNIDLKKDVLEMDTRTGKLALNGKELAMVESVDIHCTPDKCTVNIKFETEVDACLEIVGKAY